jgi:tetratricopeptide (TPR) repeat protein
MIRIYQVLFLFLIANYGIGQPADKLAENLRKEGQLTEAIEAYKATYSQSPDNWQNTYDLACAYALTYQTDSAFHYLNMAIKGEESLWPLADTDLLSLIDDPRWAGIEDYLINKYQEQNKKLKQPEYAKKLLRLIIKDQALDYYVDQAKAAYMKEGNIPHWYYPIGAYKQEIGQKNYEVMKELLEEYGWPKYSTVGELAADAPLLIINLFHLNILYQFFRPLPIIVQHSQTYAVGTRLRKNIVNHRLIYGGGIKIGNGKLPLHDLPCPAMIGIVAFGRIEFDLVRAEFVGLGQLKMGYRRQVIKNK